YSDGTSAQVTNSVAWTPVDTNTATVAPSGLLSGVDVGRTTVTAMKDGIISNTVTVNVSAAVITAIQVTPSPMNVAKGQTEQLVATATYSDGTSAQVTNSVAWTPVDTNTATVAPSGLLSGVEVGTTTVTAMKDGITSNTVTVNVSAAVITAIQVTPSPVNIVKGQTEPLVATATYSDGTSAQVSNSVAWTSVDTNTATVAPSGLLSGVEVGTTTVTAMKDGITSNTVTVNVSAAVITAIQVTPALVNIAKGQTEPLVATATYSDGTSAQVTNSVAWTPVDTNTATVAPSGLLSGVEVGTTTVTAMKDGITSNTVTVNVSAAVITAIQVTPSPVNIAKGQTEPLVATATYSDGTSAQVTNSVAWTPVDTNTATVAPSGLLSGVDVGTTTVTAMKDGITSNTVTVNVSAAVITAIQVTPSPMNVAKGQIEQLVATATYSDGTSAQVSNSVAWTTVDTNTATVAPSGLLSGVNVGTTTVTAMKDGITSNTVTVNVSAAVITAIQVTPSPMNVAKGQTEQLVATATYSDGTSAQVSNSVAWRSVDTNTATVSPSGLLTGVEVGLTTVTAMKDGITSNRVTVNVSAAVITAIQVTSPSVDVAKGLEQPLAAIATYSDGTSAQVTNSVAWTSVDTNTATVTSSGMLSGVNVGSTTVTAMKDGITSNTVNVKVCRDLDGPCIDIFDTGSGKLFTSAPSYDYISKMSFGHSGISGYQSIFDWANSNSLCARYNTKSIGGRSNWRLATRRELKELHDVYGNMNTARGWPIGKHYWSVTPDGSSYYYVDLRSGYTGSTNPVDGLFASCVSEP
uniref:Ig-like domain-containing protein n=3 Tax=Vibrio cholerae TaxID=666 RepID=UPI00115A9CA3